MIYCICGAFHFHWQIEILFLKIRFQENAEKIKVIVTNCCEIVVDCRLPGAIRCYGIDNGNINKLQKPLMTCFTNKYKLLLLYYVKWKWKPFKWFQIFYKLISIVKHYSQYYLKTYYDWKVGVERHRTYCTKWSTYKYISYPRPMNHHRTQYTESSELWIKNNCSK